MLNIGLRIPREDDTEEFKIIRLSNGDLQKFLKNILLRVNQQKENFYANPKLKQSVKTPKRQLRSESTASTASCSSESNGNSPTDTSCQPRMRSRSTSPQRRTSTYSPVYTFTKPRLMTSQDANATQNDVKPDTPSMAIDIPSPMSSRHSGSSRNSEELERGFTLEVGSPPPSFCWKTSKDFQQLTKSMEQKEAAEKQQAAIKQFFDDQELTPPTSEPPSPK